MARAAPAKGDIYWYEPDPVMGSEQAGRRPAVIVSRDSINRSSPVLVLVPLTSYRGQRLYPSDVLVPSQAGLARDSVALGLHIRAVDRRRLRERICSLPPATLRAISKAILIVLDMEP
ncbi:MAG: type II toxin-antitoxin system PemK/MazF family toxin [Armatimonadetes bacterium]|nr:type II toxin-antitoxin system PemK/MazF family toxin [Armatimonadota bacterium]